MQTQLIEAWLRDYMLLALRVNRHLTAESGGTLLIYTGPEEWKHQLDSEPAPYSATQLIDECGRLRENLPVEGQRAAYLEAQLIAMAAAIDLLDPSRAGKTDIIEQASRCLGVTVAWEPESLFESAHDRLDAALPRGSGTVAERLHRWQHSHALPAHHRDRLPDLVARAIDETCARTRQIISLPEDISIEVQLDSGPHRGHYGGGTRGTMYINNGMPFNLADLNYVVAHEGFPGHIAESMLKDIHLIHGADYPEHHVRFMMSPSFVISEGIGLHAERILFAGDESQRWITDNVLVPLGIELDHSDFREIREARNILWGVWGNAALMAADKRSDTEITDYLTRWGLLTQEEADWAVGSVHSVSMAAYVLSYYHGWRILNPWLDRPERVRRLLTEAVLPSDIN